MTEPLRALISSEYSCETTFPGAAAAAVIRLPSESWWSNPSSTPRRKRDAPRVRCPILARGTKMSESSSGRGLLAPRRERDPARPGRARPRHLPRDVSGRVGQPDGDRPPAERDADRAQVEDRAGPGRGAAQELERERIPLPLRRLVEPGPVRLPGRLGEHPGRPPSVEVE